jgi:hypothetical protein
MPPGLSRRHRFISLLHIPLRQAVMSDFCRRLYFRRRRRDTYKNIAARQTGSCVPAVQKQKSSREKEGVKRR